MIPMKLTDATRSMTKPESWDPRLGECETLDIHDSRSETGAPMMTSAWQFEEGELEKLTAGAPLYLRIYGNQHPVVALFAGNPEDLG